MARDQALANLERLKHRPFRIKDAAAAGVADYELRRLRDSGDLIELARGIFQRVEADPSATIDLATVSTLVPRGTICANSALAHWELTDEIPSTVHIAVPRGAHRPRISHPPTTVHVFAAETFSLGRVHAGDENGEFWISSPERTVIDAMRLPNVVGRDQALTALRRYLDRRGARPGELVDLAERLRAGRPVRHALEVLLA